MITLGTLGLGAAKATEVPARPTVPLTVLAFGTSLTLRGGWTEPLQQVLSRCLAGEVSVKTIALAGANSDWGMEQLDAALALRPNIVTIEFSMNDAALNRGVSLAHSRSNAARMIARFKAADPSVRILLLAMNPVSGLRGMARPWLNDFYDAYRDLAAAESIEFVDFRPDWNALPSGERDRAIPDGVHPNVGYGARIVAPKLAHILGGDTCG
jgi:lysophospholipase L1-like esterase